MTLDEKIVEAVARAIYHGKPRNKPWDLLTHEFKNQYRKPARAAITAYQAEAWQGEEAEYEVWQDDMPVASASGPQDRALAEARHYAVVYGQDGPVQIKRVLRQVVDATCTYAAPKASP